MSIETLLRVVRLAILVTLMAVVASVRGQGLPMISDPIDTHRLMEMADALDLSPDQRLGLEPIHDAYMARFARFRDGDIEEFQDALLGIGMSFMQDQFRIPERERLEELLASYEEVLDRITEIDRTLLSELEVLLTDEQQQKMERVRRRRELEVHGMIVLEMSGDMNEGAGVNLSNMLDDIELTPAELEAVDVMRSRYEATLLARVHGLHEAFEEAAVFVLDTIDEMGIREMTVPELMELGQDPEMIATVQVRFDEGSKPVQAANHALSQLNLRTYRTLVPLLEPEHAEELRDRYYRRAYRRAWRGKPEWRVRYERAVHTPDLAADVIESIETAGAGYARQEDQIVEAIVVVLEDARAYRSFARMSEMEPDPDREKRDELVERRSAIAEQAEETLASLLGPAAYAAVDSIAAPADEKVHGGGAVAAKEDGPPRPGAADDEETAAERMRRVPGLPRALPTRDRKTLADRLELTASQRAVLKTLHQDYLSEWAGVIDGATGSADRGDDRGERNDLDAETMTATWSALATLDETFFEEIELTLTTAAREGTLAQLRQARRHTVLLDAARGLGRRGDAEGWVDLTTLALRSTLSNEEMARIAGDLEAYAHGFEPLLDDRLELARIVRRRRSTLDRVRDSDRPGADELAESVEGKWRDARRDVESKAGEIGAMNRRAVNELAAALDAGPGQQLRFAYNREAHPDVYRNAVELEKMFDTALGLADLAPHQRDRIAEIATEFREGYDGLAERAIAYRRARTSFGDMPSLPQIEREIAIERLRFDTRELTARTRMRLELTLTPQQATALPPRQPRRR